MWEQLGWWDKFFLSVGGILFPSLEALITLHHFIMDRQVNRFHLMNASKAENFVNVA